MPTDEPDLVPLHSEAGPAGFDKVLRGYDPRQVDDYLDRVDAALSEADALHADDGERLATTERELAELRVRLEQAEQRAAGRPEPASLVGERLARMLALAEEESAAMRASAREEADQLILSARETAERDHAERTAALEQRERDIEGAATEADRIRLEAQRDAETVRDSARRAAEEAVQAAQGSADATLQAAQKATDDKVRAAQKMADDLGKQAEKQADVARKHADEDVRRMHDEARAAAVRTTDSAQREVRELIRQRDTIAQQLQALRETLGAVTGPLAGPVPRNDERQGT